MISENDCLNEMFVEIEWSGRMFGVPLSQLEGIEVDKNTEEAISDWHYWWVGAIVFTDKNMKISQRITMGVQLTPFAADLLRSEARRAES